MLRALRQERIAPATPAEVPWWMQSRKRAVVRSLNESPVSSEQPTAAQASAPPAHVSSVGVVPWWRDHKPRAAHAVAEIKDSDAALPVKRARHEELQGVPGVHPGIKPLEAERKPAPVEAAATRAYRGNCVTCGEEVHALTQCRKYGGRVHHRSEAKCSRNGTCRACLGE